MQEKTVFSAVSHLTEELRLAVKARGHHVGKRTTLQQLLEDCEEDSAFLAGVRTKLSRIFTEFAKDFREPVPLRSDDDLHEACRVLDQLRHDHRREIEEIERCEHIPNQQQLHECHY